MRFNFEGAGPTVADVDDAGIFAGALEDELAAGGQTLEVNAGGLVGAMLAPHDAEDAEFGAGGFASVEELLDFFVLVGSEAVFPDHLRCNCGDRRGGHLGNLYCRILNNFSHAEFVNGADKKCSLSRLYCRR